MERLLLQSIWIPAVGGIICLILVRVRGAIAETFLDTIRKIISLVVTVYSLYLGIILFRNPDIVVNLGILDLGPLSTNILLIAKPFSGLMLIFAGLFALMNIIFSWPFRAKSTHNNWYYGLSLLTLSAANAVFLAADLFTLTVAWELSTLFLFGLIALGDNKDTQLAAGKTFVILGLSEAVMLISVLYIWVYNGTLVMSSIYIPVNSTLSTFLYFSFAAAAIAKAGALPLHSWIPTCAKGAPTSIMAYLPASLDKLLGIFLFYIITWQLFGITAGIKLTFMIIGAATIIIAVVMAMLQHNLKVLLAYHAISQVGYMILGIATGHPIGIIGGLFHMLNHAVYKSSLFFAAGAVEKSTGVVELDKLGGLGKKMPVLFFANIVAAFAISGVPPFNGFVSKWMVYQACVEINQPIFFIIAIFGSVLTLASFIKLIHSVYMGSTPDNLRNVKAPGFGLTFPPLLLSIICIIFGLAPGLPVSRIAQVTGLTISGTVNTFWISFKGSLWQPMIAFGFIVLGVIITYIYYASGKALKARRDRSFIGGIKPGTIAGYHKFTNEAIRVPGTGFYENIKELPVLKTILPDAEKGAFDPYSYINKIGYFILVKPLKLLHNGILSAYLSWAILGLVIILIVLVK